MCLSAHPARRTAWPAIPRTRLSLSKSLHHDSVSCRGQKVIPLFHDLAILAMVEPELIEPFFKMRENLETSGLHQIQHLNSAGLDAVAAIFERGAFWKRV